MKRDLELIRTILLKCEEDETGHLDCDSLVTEQDSLEKIAYHTRLLVDENFIEVISKGSLSDTYGNYSIKRLTAQGHNYLDSVRNDSVWKDIKKRLAESAVTVSLTVITKVAESIILSRLGVG